MPFYALLFAALLCVMGTVFVLQGSPRIEQTSRQGILFFQHYTLALSRRLSFDPKEPLTPLPVPVPVLLFVLFSHCIPKRAGQNKQQ